MFWAATHFYSAGGFKPYLLVNESRGGYKQNPLLVLSWATLMKVNVYPVMLFIFMFLKKIVFYVNRFIIRPMKT